MSVSAERSASRKKADPRTLSAVFAPASVAVYGASSDGNKIGGRPLRYLREYGFGGAIFPINPARDTVQGLKSYPTAVSIGEAIDLAIIVVPTERVIPALEDCVAKGVRSAVVLTAGFAEAGVEGAGLQERLGDLAQGSGMRILGPNCLGFVNGAYGVSATFSPSRELRWPRLGSVGFVSQSGAFGSHYAAVSCNRGLGLGTWITTGNEADIDVADCISYLAEDPAITVIAGYIEGCRDTDRFAAALDRAREFGKPVFLLKAGTTDVGAAAALSHTAALAGRDELFDALFRQHGVVRVRSIEELLDAAYVAAPGIKPASRRTAIISTSGGVGVLMADTAVGAGLEIDVLPAAVQESIREILPLAGTRNPIDTTAQMVNDISTVAKCFKYVIEGGENDIVIAHISFIGYDNALMDRIAEPLFELRRQHPAKLFLLSMLSEVETRRRFEDGGFLVFEDPTRAVLAAARCGLASTFLRNPGRAPEILSGGMPEVTDEALTEHGAKRLLAAAGIPVTLETVTRSARDAVDAARRIGFPVVLKIVSPEIAHKTEVGGVLLGLADAEAVAAGFDEICLRVSAARPDARIDGVLVAQQIVGGVETIAGIVEDPVLGAFVMFGLGGIFAETLKDVVFRRAPFDWAEAEAMIRELKAFGVLAGARGLPSVNLRALAETLSRLSHLAAANAGRLKSLDINPLIARSDGVFAVDGLVIR